MLIRFVTPAMAILALAVFAAAGMGQERTDHSSKPGAAEVVNRMRQALEPTVPSVRVMTLKVYGQKGSVVQWRMAQARAEVNGSKWMLTVMVLPSSWGEGIALLDEDNPSSAGGVEYIYLPAVQRVRRFTWLQAWEPFFGSDFSFQDFSFPRLGGNAKVKGTGMHNGAECYRLEERLANNPYYSKVETWVAADTGLPVERDYYDLSGKLYKTERYEQIVTIQNVPTIMKIVMTDVQMDRSSELDVTSVKYDKAAPAKLFDPDNLPNAAGDQFWKGAMS
jgi:hypothetical protein